MEKVKKNLGGGALLENKEKIEKRTGFTLVEMIAVIVILGILSLVVVVSVSFITSKMRNSYYKKQKDLILLAGKDYFSDHRSKLPKRNIDFPSSVTVKTLVDRRYLDPPKDYKGISCVNESSKVFVWKKSNGEYQYNVYWSCDNENLGGDQYKDNEKPNAPSITIASNKDYAITIQPGKDHGTPTSGICETYYTINEEKITKETGTPYYGKFYVTDHTGEIIIRSVSYDCAGNVSEVSESNPFYINTMYCDASLPSNCNQNHQYDASCKGEYNETKKACIYQYKADSQTGPNCNKAGESKYSATECSTSKEAHCLEGSQSGNSCISYDYYQGSGDVTGQSCCICGADKIIHAREGYGCSDTHYAETENGGCPLGTSRQGTVYGGSYSNVRDACGSGSSCSNPKTSWAVSAAANCAGPLIANPRYTSLSYRCPASYQDVNNQCVRTAELITTYSCRNADSRNGVTCTKITQACEKDEFYHNGKCYAKKGRP